MRGLQLVLHAVCLLLVLRQAQAQTFTGRVVRVLDGDTITIERATNLGRSQVRVQLHGIDAPEPEQPHGLRAKRALTELALGKTAEVRVKETDAYGRIVGVVVVGERNLNKQMVKDGHAWWYRKYAPKETELRDLEAAAKKAKRGLWADANPTPPWDFRCQEAKSRGQ